MLAGPPRLVSLATLIIICGLGWWYFQIASAPSSTPHFKTDTDTDSAATSWMHQKPDPLDFSIPIRFAEGAEKAPGQNYSHVIVVPKTNKEDLGWMEQDLPDFPLMIYEVDNEHAKNKVPKNKGREAMVYLTYIIDHYDHLPDTVVFMHSHKHAWHNNMLMGLDAAQMMKRLNHARVARMGYMNVRCHHEPGCPDWIHMDRPGGDFDFFHKPEEPYMRRHIWEELHPGAPIPPSLSGICCAQFAVSRDRIRQVPVERFRHYRQWLIDTTLDDQFSGRIFEYIWHYIFTGHEVLCPAMNTCYCDGYGFCFGGRQKFADYFAKQDKRNEFNEELNKFEEDEQNAQKEGKPFELSDAQKERKETLRNDISRMDTEMENERNEAMKRGEDPEMRARETENYDSSDIFEYLPGKSKGPPA